MSKLPEEVVSGGQAGADRAALDWAIAHGVPHGGWCPRGRRAEDGRIDDRYQLKETPSASYIQRTEWNVRDSDATVIITVGTTLRAGPKRTAEFAQKHGKPCLHLSAQAGIRKARRELRAFIRRRRIKVLNVAGSRASKEPDVQALVMAVLEAMPFQT